MRLHQFYFIPWDTKKVSDKLSATTMFLAQILKSLCYRLQLPEKWSKTKDVLTGRWPSLFVCQRMNMLQLIIYSYTRRYVPKTTIFTGVKHCYDFQFTINFTGESASFALGDVTTPLFKKIISWRYKGNILLCYLCTSLWLRPSLD